METKSSFTSCAMIIVLLGLNIIALACTPQPTPPGPAPNPSSPTPAPKLPSPTPVTPAESTPILETILDIDHRRLATYHHEGVFEMEFASNRIELRLRVLFPNGLQVKIDNQLLPSVAASDTASHPELEASGYYQIWAEVPVQSASMDPRFFERVYVVLPRAKWGDIDYKISVLANYPFFPESEKQSPPLDIQIVRKIVPYGSMKPSQVFWAPTPDGKHFKYDGDGGVGTGGAFIADHVTLAGWLVGGEGELQACKDNDIEDIHYSLWLDNDFIERNYAGTNIPLNNAVMPGRWFTWLDDQLHPRLKMSLTNGKPPDASTFLIPGYDALIIELNAWHKSKHNNQIPGNWVADSVCNDVYWPFKPLDPQNTGKPLQAGDYVIITGALVEDSGHIHEGEWDPNNPGEVALHWRHECWFHHYQGHSGWLEIHPLDSLRRVIAPTVTKHPQMVQLCDDGNGKTPRQFDYYLTPTISDPPKLNSVLKYREIVDERFIKWSTVAVHIAEIDKFQPAKLHVRVDLDPLKNGNFKAIYLLWWEDAQGPRPTPVPAATDQSVEDAPVCLKKPFLPQCNPPSNDKH